jgi:hypothetical protein
MSVRIWREPGPLPEAVDRSDLYTRNLVCLAFRGDISNEPNSTDRLVLLNRMCRLGAWQRSDVGHTPGADIKRCHHLPGVGRTRGVELYGGG